MGLKGEPSPFYPPPLEDSEMSEIDDKTPLSTSASSVEFVYNDHEVLDLLRIAIEHEGSQVAFAKHHGINRTFLNMVLKGKRPVGDAVAGALGLHKVYVASPVADRCETEIAPKMKFELIAA
jgi:hypothetical protein